MQAWKAILMVPLLLVAFWFFGRLALSVGSANYPTVLEEHQSGASDCERILAGTGYTCDKRPVY